MAVSSYRDVNWGNNEILATDKLNTMASNTRYLFERAPKMYYNAYGVRKDTGVKIAAGVCTFAPSKSTIQSKTVSFGSFFTVNSRPVITTGIYSGGNRRIVVTYNGIQSVGWTPDHRGFVAHLSVATLEKGHYIYKPTYVNWMAIGF